MDKASQGYDVTKAWLKDFFNIEVVEDAPLPALIDSVDIVNDESDVSPIVEESSKFIGRNQGLSVTNAQSVESLSIIRHNLSLTNYVCLTDFNSKNILPLTSESQFDYDNKAPP